MFIDEYTFGSIRVEGRVFRHDLRIRGRKILPDWWRRQGHVCALEDLADILNPLPGLVILGTGASGLMRISPSLARWLEDRTVSLLALPTAEAVQAFNRYHPGTPGLVAAFHLTC